MSRKQKKWLSEGSDEQKTEKNGFPRARMSRKQQKQRFGHGRKTKNGENCISATAETGKTPQNGFPTPWKWRKCFKRLFQPLGSGKMDA